ncbi:DUF749 domain-containing protein [Methanobacterium alcaliphilum]|uniref:DUF749 domain-containing protein n=1 Tax=Methanobacterium alcaliphilum TaxID=392018 RepID=UPI00200B7756|nr:DUF749 domain-containing protein [Methanobacterium alcaliphilum]MCK9151271.1 DUF749 domain-containing protein [Methanobacterium alcaliphilum]
MFIATLAGIFKFNELPEEYGSFVDFKARLEKKEIDDDDEIAILNIKGTESYHVLFLDSYENINEIKEELKDADAKINHTSLKILEGHL